MRDASKHPNRTMIRFCCVCMVALTVAASAATANGPINPGDDIWGTPCGGGAYVDFSNNAIPADYFGVGSDPFTGQVMLGGDPTQVSIFPPEVPDSDVDTVVRRGGTSPGFTCGSPPETVPIEIISLSLQSCSPITVTFNGGTTFELWNVQVCLNPPQLQGSMTISHECPNGGSYASTLPVSAQLQFTRIDGVPAPSPPFTDTLSLSSSGWWSHTDPVGTLARIPAGSTIIDLCTGQVNPTFNVMAPDFYPGLWSGDCIDCLGSPGTFDKPALTPEQALLAAHGIFPPNPSKPVGPDVLPVLTEACCLPDGTCIDVAASDCGPLFGGIPQGAGTNCANTPCGGGLGCPLDPADPAALCAPLQTFMCDTGLPTDVCLPSIVQISPTGGPEALACECFTPGPKCGPIAVGADGNTLSCIGTCPFPNPIGTCTVFADDGTGPVSQNSSSVLASDYPFGTQFTCQCAGPPPDDHITVSPTQVNFGGGGAIAPIPADFFGPGSQPFAGTVQLEGAPGGPSVSLQRSADPVTPGDPVGSQGTVDIELVALALRSTAPITVNFGGGMTEAWDMSVSNIGSNGADGVSQNPGTFHAVKDHVNGGNFDANFLVCPVMTFTRVSDHAILMLDLCPSMPPDPAEPLQLSITGPFTHNVDPALGIAVPPGATMTTGVQHEDIGAPGNPQSVVPIQATTADLPPSVIHTVTPPPLLCPLVGDPVTDLCAPLQSVQCAGPSTDVDQCRPTQVTVVGGIPIADACECITPGNKCGPIDFDPLIGMLVCPGGCPPPNPPGNCSIHVNGEPTGAPDISPSMLPDGSIVTCACTTPALVGCCWPDGFCTNEPTGQCGGVVQPTLCTGTIEACCFTDGSCLPVDPMCCDDLGGTSQGAGSTCADTNGNGTADVCEPTGACCLPASPFCIVTNSTDCAAQGTYLGNGTACAGVVAACCLPNGSCTDTDIACCTAQGGSPQAAGSACNDGTVDCSVPCLPDAAGIACQPVVCPVPSDQCEPRCVQFDPATGATTITDCDCRGLNECQVGGVGVAVPEGAGNPCVVSNVGGTVVLPPIGCDYLSPDEVHMIVDGLPAGTTIELAPIHNEFVCGAPGIQVPCSQALGVNCEGAGGGLGGNLDCFMSALTLQVTGIGAPPIGGFTRTLAIPIATEVHSGPRTPGDAVQDFDTEMFRLSGDLIGDPDFCTFHVAAGSDFGLPSPGHTTLTQLPSGDFAVDSFFDITYQIEFAGCPGSVLDGLAGTTTATIRMETGTKPNCVGNCPVAGETCVESLTVDPLTGLMDICCDCVAQATGACCLPITPCQIMTQTACIAAGGQYAGDGTVCGPVQACCTPDGGCADIETTCCTLGGGTPQQGAGSACNDGVVDCSAPCVPNLAGSACEPVICPDTVPPLGVVCESRCVNFDPTTGVSRITDCDCRTPDECHVQPVGPVGGPAPEGPGANPCVVADVGGTVVLPPVGCDYLSPDEVHVIVDGLPAGTTLELAPIHKNFICNKAGPMACSVVIPPPDCEAPGGTLGGNVDCFGSSLDLAITSVGPGLPGFNRNLSVFVFAEVHSAPRTPGDPVQEFDTDMFSLQGELFGDPDFCTFRVTGGTANGLPSPGHTTLTRLPSGDWAVDSFFDITYRIDFAGCPGSVLDGMVGTTQATIHMQTGGVPQCVGGCAANESCVRSETVLPDGTIDTCCDCVPGIACVTAADCADVVNNTTGMPPADGITDDVCTWWACVSGVCVSTPLSHPSDMGGAGGACPPDTNCNLADALTALKCFSGQSPCEKINIDAGGAAGSCPPDGNCNLADALAALTCFAGTNTCTCGPSPTETNTPTKAGSASLHAVANARSIKAGGKVQVRVFVDQPLKALLGYQLTVVASGGRNGSLELVDIEVEGRRDAVYGQATNPYKAFNVENGQMLAGNFDGAVSTGANGYLATFTYRASDDAVGTFVVDVVRNDLTQTMMVGAKITDDIVVSGTRPAVIVVNPASRSAH